MEIKVNGELIEKAMKFTLNDTTKITLQYILIEDAEKDENTVTRHYVASDGRSLFVACYDVKIEEGSDKIPNGKLLIRPIKTFKAHSVAVLKPIEDNFYLLKGALPGFEGITICHSIDENYPNWRAVVPADDTLKPTEDYVQLSWKYVKLACETMKIDNLPQGEATDGKGAHTPNVFKFANGDIKIKIVIMPLKTN